MKSIIKIIIALALCFVIGIPLASCFSSCSSCNIDVGGKNELRHESLAAESSETVGEETETPKNPYENANDPNTEKDGTVMSTDSITGYYLTLKLSGIEFEYPEDKYNWLDLNTVFRGNPLPTNSPISENPRVYDITTLFTFGNVRYNNKSVFISAQSRVHYTNNAYLVDGEAMPNKRFFMADIEGIRIPASYYNYLKWEEENGKDLKVITPMFIGERMGVSVPAITCEYELYTKDIPADSDDPTSPNFELGSIGGLKNLISIYTPHNKLSVAHLVLYIIMGVLVIGLVAAVVTWIVKKCKG